MDSEQKDMEPQDEFERELRQAFARRPAPPSLKRKLMQTRRTKRKPLAWFTWQRLAASLVLTAILAGGIAVMPWKANVAAATSPAKRHSLVAFF